VYFKFFLSLFEDTNPEIRSRLCSGVVYSLISPTHVVELQPAFLKFMQSLKSWRQVQACVQSFLAWPVESVVDGAAAFAPVVFDFLEREPHALVSCANRFCHKMTVMLSAANLAEFGDEIIRRFAKNPRFCVRQIFPLLGGALCVPNQAEEVVDRIFAAFVQLARDPVISVRASVIPHLTRIHLYYAKIKDQVKEREVTTLFVGLGLDCAPWIEAKWQQASASFDFTHAHSDPPKHLPELCPLQAVRRTSSAEKSMFAPAVRWRVKSDAARMVPRPLIARRPPTDFKRVNSQGHL
jgi:hypothetical protein